MWRPHQISRKSAVDHDTEAVVFSALTVIAKFPTLVRIGMARSDNLENKIHDALKHARADTRVGPARFNRVLDQMYKAYAKDVREHALNRVPEACVEDVCAATWDAVPRALENFNGESTFRTWLLGIATHKACDELRRAHDRQREALSNVISSLVMQAPSRDRPSRQLARAEMDRIVRQLIEELAPDDRELLLLHYEAGRTAADIARERGLAPNTVAQRLVRARERIREALAAAGVD